MFDPILAIAQFMLGIKLCWPQARIITLVENESQQQTVRLVGADAAFIKGVQARKLLEAAELLL